MKRIIQIISLLCLFIIAQAVASLATLFLFNIPALFSQGIFDMNILVTSAWAMGFSLFLSCIFCIGGMMPLHAIDYERLLPNGNREKSFGYTLLLMLPSIFLINLFCESLSLEDINKDIFSLMMYNPLGVASIVLFGPLAEELIFRMGIQTGLVKAGLSPLQAIVAGALIFGVIHLNPAQIPGAALFGLILGWLYWRSGTIWIPVAAHVMNNLTGVALVWLTGNTDQTLAELCGGTWQAVACATLSAILFVWAFRKLQRIFQEDKQSS